ncbi:ATP-binding cassette domain-containing protein [Companilactobacillus sp.]|jgi:ABC-2 type transport system ATP-binding protein|uniref:ATP-binding cassette domain-containing protein n=1 Tax=Companilactobacillus sp. TaxID=2767905 RepID=UPI0025BDAA45|nr:ATP-binding cassette domain-containing protein [Companilactobacillus sp.]MCH4008679.1 ATP-binding cassette domain-containing protein [Companilactobacillus sp.]MCH4051142.1 ATP-binding cassette domain-containing protein [Companilactobacillus sp.]MCH4076622.1 ATP-binding cassette domain-containing protein [Companilactobacillus sp.]MCH4125197.1 ATP-binding cassette domain-containing protein [Companilactobacillus sp.]MCH4131737.1 ATP-binding cassette domain-containing protein [Companilactobacil
MDNILEIEGLNKHFGSKSALKDVGFKIKQGHIVGLVGPNGAGKSTIMKSILGLTSSESGEIKLDSELITVSNHPKLSQAGALIEYPGIYPYMTGYEHLKLFAVGGRAEDNISQTVQDLGMEQYIIKKAKSYSLGMKQKLGIALALVNQPKLLILDEPMNGLDPQANKSLRKLLVDKAKSGMTILISSHILSELEKIVDDVVVIDKGSVVADAPIDQILHSDRQAYVLETSDDLNARDILENSNYDLADDQSLIINKTENVTLAKALRLLIETGIDVYNVERQNIILEDSLLQILQDDNQ